MKRFFVDSHVHLNMDVFDKDREDVIKRANDVSVKYFLNVSYDRASSLSSNDLSMKNPLIFSSIGFHPHDAKEFACDDLSLFKKLIEKNKKIVAIGEIGLDYFRNLSPKEIQKKVFVSQIEFAISMNLPIVIHERDAFLDVLDIVRRYRGKIRGVFHCFNHNVDRMREIIRMGFYIGIGGPLTYPKNENLREAVKFAPLDRILVETDSPYLPPQGKRGKRNEPSFMIITAKKIAEIKKISLEKLMEVTTKNFENLFKVELI